MGLKIRALVSDDLDFSNSSNGLSFWKWQNYKHICYNSDFSPTFIMYFKTKAQEFYATQKYHEYAPNMNIWMPFGMQI